VAAKAVAPACAAVAESAALPGHEHVCVGDHAKPDDHWCRGCRRWFWVPTCDVCGGPHPHGNCLL
jgi:hypothetical protein